MSKPFDRFMVALNAPSNPKIKRMKRAGKEVRWAWFHGVLAIAAQAPVRGYFVVGDAPANEHDVAEVADVTLVEARRALEVGRDLGMLYPCPELGVEMVHDFEELNPAPKRDATNAERQARWRANQKKRNAASNTPRNAVTPVTKGLRNAGEVEVEVEEQQGGDVSAFPAPGRSLHRVEEVA